MPAKTSRNMVEVVKSIRPASVNRQDQSNQRHQACHDQHRPTGMAAPERQAGTNGKNHRLAEITDSINQPYGTFPGWHVAPKQNPECQEVEEGTERPNTSINVG